MTDWIDHDGKGMPVDGEEFVDVKFRDGDTFGAFVEARIWHSTDATHQDEDSCWLFSDKHDDSDIVAYKRQSSEKAGT